MEDQLDSFSLYLDDDCEDVEVEVEAEESCSQVPGKKLKIKFLFTMHIRLLHVYIHIDS